jgi:hypothetical protein
LFDANRTEGRREKQAMSTSILYHAFGLKGIHYESTRYFGDCILIEANIDQRSDREGTNNKIKTLKRQAYGYRYMEYFKLGLYHLHTQSNRATH